MADRSRSRSNSRSRSRSRERDSAEEGAAEVAPAEGETPAKPVEQEGGDEPQQQQQQQQFRDDQQDDFQKPIELYVGNLDFSTRDADLEEEFRKEAPNLIEAKVVMQKFDNSRSRGFALKSILLDKMSKTTIKLPLTTVDQVRQNYS
jgi:hypothetical protein